MFRLLGIVTVLFVLSGCVPSNIHYNTPYNANSTVRSVSVSSGYNGNIRWTVRTDNLRVGN